MNNVLRWLRYTFIGAEKPPDLEEAHYPRDGRGAPDLTCFTRPVEHYARYIDDYLEFLDSPRVAPRGAPPLASEWHTYDYQKYALGQWGLIARGPSEALPTVLRLLQHRMPEGRQTASGVLEAWADGGTAIDELALAAAEKELADPAADIETLSILVGILGHARFEASLPLLARVLRDPNSVNGDVDWCAVEAIGEIAGLKFVEGPDPKQAAERWLQQRGL